MKNLFPLITLLIIILLFSIWLYKTENYNPKFKSGECAIYINPNVENWEKPELAKIKILEVGKEKYLYLQIMDNHYSILNGSILDGYINSIDKYYSKIECPNEN